MSTWLEKNARRLEKPRQLLPNCLPEPGGTWADFGCGEGVFSVVLYEIIGPDCEIHAVDKNRGVLRRLKANFADVYPQATIHAHKADFRKPLDIPKLDGFVIANALHFVFDDQKEEVLQSLIHHLKPGGRAIIVEYNAHRGNLAVPHPLDDAGFIELGRKIGLVDVRISARAPSSFMEEMYAGVGITPSPWPSGIRYSA
jgi:ubiquinone/menaquinone biosynthesis C-methylase UbiE